MGRLCKQKPRQGEIGHRPGFCLVCIADMLLLELRNHLFCALITLVLRTPRGTDFVCTSRDLLLQVLSMRWALTKLAFRDPHGCDYCHTACDLSLLALSIRCYLNPAIICRAVTAHSSPLLPRRPPLRSCACKRLFVVISPNITGVSYSTFSLESPAVTPSQI